MKNFDYQKAENTQAAIALLSPSVRPLAGGTNLVDLMRENIEQPQQLVDVAHLNRHISVRADGTLILGAGAKNTAVAEDASVRANFPLISQAILHGASGQIRNMASVAGNLMQRTRCLYFYDSTTRCNKRCPGSGCDAREGFHRMHAVLGGSDSCISAHPSDFCVALAAHDASVLVEGPSGKRTIAFHDFHLLPGDTPEREHELRADEVITAVTVPPLAYSRRSLYRKVRDRSSYAFALVSLAVALDLDHTNNRVREVRLALGGLATKPWRAYAAEELLRDCAPSEANFRQSAEAALDGAVGLPHNAFKIELAKRVIVDSLLELKERKL